MTRVSAVFLALAAWLAVPGQPASPPQPAATFTHDVAPILYARCVGCHRPGQIGPMSLLSYEEARPWARSIKRMVTERRMPPWFADPAIGTFANDPSLNQNEIDTISRWVDAGAPQGDPQELPRPPADPSGWRIGRPDLVLTIPKAFDVPANGVIDYQYFDVPSGLTADRWVQAFEVRPSDRRVVHHVTILMKHPKVPRNTADGDKVCVGAVCGDVDTLDSEDAFTAVALGTQPEVYPHGTGRLLKAGTTFRLQIHYTTMGTPATDRTSIGFVFAKERPATALELAPLGRRNFTIPPQTANFPLDATMEFQKDATIWRVGAHNHFRGRSWKYELEEAGMVRPILSIPRFDFHWQLNYLLEPRLDVKRGARLRATVVFDNSPANPANPDPNVPVRYGDQTTDEMMLSMVLYSVRK